MNGRRGGSLESPGGDDVVRVVAVRRRNAPARVEASQFQRGVRSILADQTGSVVSWRFVGGHWFLDGHGLQRRGDGMLFGNTKDLINLAARPREDSSIEAAEPSSDPFTRVLQGLQAEWSTILSRPKIGRHPARAAGKTVETGESPRDSYRVSVVLPSPAQCQDGSETSCDPDGPGGPGVGRRGFGSSPTCLRRLPGFWISFQRIRSVSGSSGAGRLVSATSTSEAVTSRF